MLGGAQEIGALTHRFRERVACNARERPVDENDAPLFAEDHHAFGGVLEGARRETQLLLGLLLFRDVVREDQPRHAVGELEVAGSDIDVNQGAVFLSMAKGIALRPRAFGGPQQRRNVFRGPQILEGHRKEFLARISVMPDR